MLDFNKETILKIALITFSCLVTFQILNYNEKSNLSTSKIPKKAAPTITPTTTTSKITKIVPQQENILLGKWII